MIFPTMRPKILPLSGNELFELVKRTTGLKGNILSVMGSPEATVLSVYDVYSWSRWMYPFFEDLKHYESIIRSRKYGKTEEALIKEARGITDFKEFIRLILREENQNIDDDTIIELLKKYNETRGQIYKKDL